ncbi:MAG: aldo/keto reductase [Clostridia bacterium]
MYYKQYGNKDFKVSAVGMGCMRFDEELVKAGRFNECAEVALYAHERGINYFDSAPTYCGDKSEEILGMALCQLPRDSFIVSSKTNFGQIGKPPTKEGFFRRLETSLTRLRVDYIDVYHLWCMMSLEQYEMQCGTMYGWFEEAKAQGLIKRIAVSSHMPGNELEKVVEQDKFEAMLIGYNALNHRFRQSGISAAHEKGMAVVAMNAVAGGLIPRNPERFAYLAEGTDLTPTQAALRFVASHKEITVALNGFTTKRHVDDAVLALEGLVEQPASELNEKWKNEGEMLRDMCTGCGYCDHCPQDIHIPRLMDAYNRKLLGEDMAEAVGHWGLDPKDADKCVACGQCESLCTQHLPIIERLREVAQAKMEE